MQQMDANMQAQRSDMQRMESRMDANAQKMKEDLQDLQTQMTGEMQSMGFNLQVSLEEVKGEMRAMNRKMAPARGGTTESGWSVMAVRTAMEMGKVEGTSDAVIIGGETGKLEQGVTEIVTGTQGETQDLEIMTETQK